MKKTLKADVFSDTRLEKTFEGDLYIKQDYDDIFIEQKLMPSFIKFIKKAFPEQFI